MAGFDARDSTSADRRCRTIAPALTAGLLTGLRIGLPKEFFGGPASMPASRAPSRRRCIDECRAWRRRGRGQLAERCSWDPGLLYVIAPRECSSNLARSTACASVTAAKHRATWSISTRSRAEGFGAEVQRRILVGTYALSAGYYDAYYLKAQQIRRLIHEDFRRAFEHW